MPNLIKALRDRELGNNSVFRSALHHANNVASDRGQEKSIKIDATPI